MGKIFHYYILCTWRLNLSFIFIIFLLGYQECLLAKLRETSTTAISEHDHRAQWRTKELCPFCDKRRRLHFFGRTAARTVGQEQRFPPSAAQLGSMSSLWPSAVIPRRHRRALSRGTSGAVSCPSPAKNQNAVVFSLFPVNMGH